jgi:DNA-binding IclR family transcriptional regulator
MLTMSEGELGDNVSDSRQGIQSVEIGSKVLFALAGAGGPLSLNELARLSGEAPNKVHRYLVSLGRVGLTLQSLSTGRYDLGPALRRLGVEALRRTNEIAVATEHAGQLRDATGYAVNVSVWTDGGPVIVRWEYGLHALSLTTRIGASLPIVESAAGQVFLAQLPPMMTQPALELQYGALTPELQQKIRKITKRVRSDGYGRTDGGVITSHLSLSAPIMAASDPMPVMLTIVMPRDGVDAAKEALALAALNGSASAAIMELGGPPPGVPMVS